MGHVRVACNSCHDPLRQTVLFEPPHDLGQRPLTGWVSVRILRVEFAGDDGQGDVRSSPPRS